MNQPSDRCQQPALGLAHDIRAITRRLGYEQPLIIDEDGTWIAFDEFAADRSELLIGADVISSVGMEHLHLVCGTREPSIAPLMSATCKASLSPELRDHLAAFPQSVEEIRQRMKDCLGLQGDKDLAAHARLAGYHLESLISVLDILRGGGPEAALLLAACITVQTARHAQGFHVEVRRSSKHPAHSYPAMRREPLLAVLRALWTCVDLASGMLSPEVAATARHMLGVLVERISRPDVTPFVVGEVTNVACKLAGAFYEFSSSNAETLSRFARLRDDLGRICKKYRDRAAPAPERFDALASPKLIQNLGIPKVLMMVKAADRTAWFKGFNTNGLFQLLLLRRLDDVLLRFPWMAVRAGDFAHCPLGLLGALAQVFETNRALDIGRCLIWRTFTASADVAAPLTHMSVKSVITNRAKMLAGASKESGVSYLLSETAFSAALIEHLRGGAQLSTSHALSRVMAGQLLADHRVAFQDPVTVATIAAAEESKEIHKEQGSYRRLYPTFAGLNCLELTFAALYSIYPKLTSAVRRKQDLLKSRRGIQGPSMAEDFDLLGAFLHVGRRQLEAIDPSHRLRRSFDQDRFDADRTRSKRLRREPPCSATNWMRIARQS